MLDGKAQRVATMLPSMHFGYDPSLKPVKQDVAKTKKLLAEAGFPNGLEIQLNCPQGRYVRDKEVAEAVAGQLTKAGIKTTLKTFEFVSYLNNDGLRAQGRARLAHRLGPGHDGRRGHLRAALPDREPAQQLPQSGFRRHGRPGADA